MVETHSMLEPREFSLSPVTCTHAIFMVFKIPLCYILYILFLRKTEANTDL